MKSFSQYLQEKMKDPVYRKHYDALEPEFAVIEAVIKNNSSIALDAKLKISIS